MRTKTLLLSAAAFVAGLLSVQAQSNEYSANVVGYVKVALTNTSGYSLVANQMDLDGTGTNNGIYTAVGTNFPVNTQLLCWNGSGFTSTKLLPAGKWSLNNGIISNAVQLGRGFFVNCPASTNLTEIGNVFQGTNKINIVAGYQLISPIVPESGTISTFFNYIPTTGDQALVWNGLGYTSHRWTGTLWTGSEPIFQIGEAMFLNAAANTNWVQSFTVH